MWFLDYGIMCHGACHACGVRVWVARESLARRGRALAVAPLRVLVAVFLDARGRLTSVSRPFAVVIGDTYYDTLLQLGRERPAFVISSLAQVASGDLAGLGHVVTPATAALKPLGLVHLALL